MAEEEVAVPSAGNPDLDPASKAETGESSNESTTPSASSGGEPDWDRIHAENAEFKPWMYDDPEYQRGDSEPDKEESTNKDIKSGRVKFTFLTGGGGGSARRAVGGAGRSSDPTYGYLKFTSPLFQQHVISSQYKLIVPTIGGYLGQVCGPFRPLVMESQGGFPQALGGECSQVGMAINMDLE
jgi:hypothetical protein